MTEYDPSDIATIVSVMTPGYLGVVERVTIEHETVTTRDASGDICYSRTDPVAIIIRVRVTPND